MVVSDPDVFPVFLTLVLTQLFFPKSPTTFPTCFCRGERRKNAGKKSSPQPPGHETDTLTTEPPGPGGAGTKGGLTLPHTIATFNDPDIDTF